MGNSKSSRRKTSDQPSQGHAGLSAVAENLGCSVSDLVAEMKRPLPSDGPDLGNDWAFGFAAPEKQLA